MKMFKGQIEWEDNYVLDVYQNHFIVYDSNRNKVYYEDSYGYWYKSEYDERGNEVYYEDSYGYWYKSEYDERGNEVYYENSYGEGIDNRKKTVTLELTEEQIKQVRELIK